MAAAVTVEITSRPQAVVEVTDPAGSVIEVSLPTTTAQIDIPVPIPAVSVDSQPLVTILDLAMLP